MKTVKFPSATSHVPPPPKSYKNSILLGLSFLILFFAAFLIVEKIQSSEKIGEQDAMIKYLGNEKSELQNSFDGSLARLDSMVTINTGLEALTSKRNIEIAKAKKEIRSILHKKEITVVELTKAKELIAQLNSTIGSLEKEVALLTQENESLTQDKLLLIQEKEKLNSDLTANTTIRQNLEKKIEIASTLNASNIEITPVNLKNNGREKITVKAKQVDKLVISFDVDNRIAKPGLTDVFVCVIGPDGKPIITEAMGSGIFSTREEGDKAFTAKVPVDIETAKKKYVEFGFKPNENFQKGNYTIQIYQNGFKIGEGTRELKKGGLFS